MNCGGVLMKLFFEECPFMKGGPASRVILLLVLISFVVHLSCQCGKGVTVGAFGFCGFGVFFRAKTILIFGCTFCRITWQRNFFMQTFNITRRTFLLPFVSTLKIHLTFSNEYRIIEPSSPTIPQHYQGHH